MSGIRMWAVFLDQTRDLQTAAFYRLENDALAARLAWHGGDSGAFVEPVIIHLERRASLPARQEPVGNVLYFIECHVCGGSGFSGQGTGYGDVCGECGGQKRFPVYDKPLPPDHLKAMRAARDALQETWEDLARCDASGKRSLWTCPEDVAVAALCERHGYGAVMDSAARLWFRKDSTGAFIVGNCAATARGSLVKLDAALSQLNRALGELT